MARLEGMEPSKHVKGRFLLHFEGGRLVKVTENEIAAFSLYPGAVLEESVLTELEQAGRASDAKALAARMVGQRPLSRKELVKRLEDKQTAPADALAAADWLEELGALDDGAYAASIARHYSARGYGRRKIQDELYRRGIPRELWAQALEEAEDPAQGVDAYLRSKLRGQLPDQKTLKRASDALLRRGYSWEEVKSGLRRYGAEVAED